MKVIILTGEPFPNGMAAVSRIKCYARAISEGGVAVEVVVYRRTELFGKKTGNNKAVGEYDGIFFRYLPGTPFRSRYCFIRYINDLRDIKRVDFFLHKNLSEGDVLFLYMEKKADLMARYIKIAHEQGAFCIHDLCELPYGTGTETKETIRKRRYTLEKVFPQLNGIISISDSLMNLAKKHTSPFCQHIKVPILVDYKKFLLSDKSKDVDIPFIFHAGTLYEQKDGILGMIEAFGKAVRRITFPIRFITTGNINNSPHHEEIKNLIAKYRLENKLIMTGYLDSDEMKDYLSKASLVIINKYKTQQNNYCFSTKLGEYLAASKPVIITNVGESMNWLENKETAYIVEPEDTDALADAIEYVFTNIEESRRIGMAGQELCYHSFDYHNWSMPLVEFLNKISSQNEYKIEN